MTQQAAALPPSARIVRWPPAEADGNDDPECRTAWRDNVARRRDFQAAHPDVIWPPRQGLGGSPWVAFVPMPDGAFLEVTDAIELGRLLDKLAVALAQRDGQSQQAA